jgi:hypothetical protein
MDFSQRKLSLADHFLTGPQRSRHFSPDLILVLAGVNLLLQYTFVPGLLHR